MEYSEYAEGGAVKTLELLSVGASLLLLVVAVAAQPRSSWSSAADELRGRATNWFGEAVLHKPIADQTNDSIFTFSPLMLQEIPGRGEGGDRKGRSVEDDLFGRLCLSNGVLVVDTSKPTVYGFEDSLQLSGTTHGRVTYVWCYAAQPAAGSRGALAFQGVRITLGTNGLPAIWEVLAAPDPFRILFVAQSLELAARARFGAPLPHRRFAAEQCVNLASNAVVARVLDDGPVPMGPIVYLTAGKRAVSTVICRCMPAQAAKLVATRSFELVRIEAPAARLLALAREQTGIRTALWPGDPDTVPLAELLRLPNF